MADQGGERTEEASPKKREDERKKGNVFMSKDIVTIVSLVISFYVFRFYVGSLIEQIQINYQIQIQRLAVFDTLEITEVIRIFQDSFILFATTMLPPILIISFASIMATMAQTRFLVSQEQIKFKMERLNPLQGIKRMISLRSLIELFKSLVKITLLVWLLYQNIRRMVGNVYDMIDWGPTQAMVFTGEEILSLALSVTIAFGALSLLDFLYQRWEYEKGIRMTKQEVKDEYKQMEGNPEIKNARRQKQREFAQKRMMQSVQQADVVVRNPTHFAVALKYTLNADPAPMVLAKGADLIAQKIVEEAQKHNIVMVENPPLARGLYETADILDYIPPEYFQPVAELLAWLYNARETGGDLTKPPVTTAVK